MNPVLSRYHELLSPLDRLNPLSRKAFGDLVRCRKGCAMCCHGLFDIGLLDALLLHDAWRVAEKNVCREIELAAESLLAAVERSAPTWPYPHFVDHLQEDEVDRILESVGMRACPVLGPDNACRLYDARPFYCRVHGLKIRDTREAGIDTEADTEEPADMDTDCEYNFATIPPREEWPAFAFSRLFAEEGRLMAEAGLNPEERFLIPAVTTTRFGEWFNARMAAAKKTGRPR